MSPIVRGAGVVLLTVGLAGCAPAPAKAQPEFTRDMAESTFAEVVRGVARNGVDGFCARHVRGDGTCAILLKDALRLCLLPGDEPRVSRVARIPAKGTSEGGRLLEVKGHTRDGQRYVSEFFVVRPYGAQPQAAFGIYWTGLGLEESPFKPGNTKVPQNACPGR